MAKPNVDEGGEPRTEDGCAGGRPAGQRGPSSATRRQIPKSQRHARPDAADGNHRLDQGRHPARPGSRGRPSPLASLAGLATLPGPPHTRPEGAG